MEWKNTTAFHSILDEHYNRMPLMAAVCLFYRPGSLSLSWILVIRAVPARRRCMGQHSVQFQWFLRPYIQSHGIKAGSVLNVSPQEQALQSDHESHWPFPFIAMGEPLTTNWYNATERKENHGRMKSILQRAFFTPTSPKRRLIECQGRRRKWSQHVVAEFRVESTLLLRLVVQPPVGATLDLALIVSHRIGTGISQKRVETKVRCIIVFFGLFFSLCKISLVAT